MRNIIVLLLAIVLLFACGILAVLVARGWFTLRATQSVPPAPTVVFGDTLQPTPTPAALPPVGATPIGGGAAAPVAAAGFNGSFAGTLSSENGSSAPTTLDLSQSADAVTGRLTIGDGLTLDAGNCGIQAVPAGTQTAAGQLDPANPNHLETTGNINAAGLTIAVRLTADLAADGQTLTARADLDLPLLCGTDPAISGTFVKQ
jgi:hypothetical protein